MARALLKSNSPDCKWLRKYNKRYYYRHHLSECSDCKINQNNNIITWLQRRRKLCDLLHLSGKLVFSVDKLHLEITV